MVPVFGRYPLHTKGEQPEIEFCFRSDQAGVDRLVDQVDKLSPDGQTELFFLLENIAAGGLDDDVQRVTLNSRYEASARPIPNTGMWVAFVCDMQSRSPKPAILLKLCSTRPNRDTLFGEARDALQLRVPEREDH